MEENPFLIQIHDCNKNIWVSVPRFRTMMPYKNPKFFVKHKELMDICDWVEINIFANMSFLTYTTLGVLVRISTGMLHKCSLPDDIIKQLDLNLVKNINKMYEKKLLSELPF